MGTVVDCRENAPSKDSLYSTPADFYHGEYGKNILIFKGNKEPEVLLDIHLFLNVNNSVLNLTVRRSSKAWIAVGRQSVTWHIAFT